LTRSYCLSSADAAIGERGHLTHSG
jgi:hypothetical protein